ncbi:MAG: amino acid adenylation domain-containing protein [Chloroflexota bacterium]
MCTITHSSFECFIIGEGTLPTSCINMLHEAGHQILGVISADPELRKWAHQMRLPLYHPKDNLYAILAPQPFDYLFSIVNPHILLPEILALPKQCAINYHDAPLPKYAGVHATTWALLNQESRHGITWHVMEEQVDAGEILQQPLFSLAPHETVFTLNIKCYEAAIASFRTLIDELASGQCKLTKQDLSTRSYFAKSKRPPQNAILEWQQSAEQIDALFRALDFGTYPNPLSRPKLALGQNLYIIEQLTIGSTLASALPGTLTTLSEESLTVATATREVSLGKLLTVDGTPISVSELIGQHDLQVGQFLPELGTDVAKQITTYHCRFSKHESFWRERLESLHPIEFPFLHRTSHLLLEGQGASQFKKIPFSIADEVHDFLVEHQYSPQHFLFTLFVIYVSRLSGMTTFDLPFTSIELARKLQGVEHVFATDTLLSVHYEATATFADVYEHLLEQRQLTEQHQSYTRDLIARIPTLSTESQVLQLISTSVSIIQVDEAVIDEWADMPFSTSAGLAFVTVEHEPSQENRLNRVCGMVTYDATRVEPDAIERMSGHLQMLMAGIAKKGHLGAEQPVAKLPLLTETEQHQLLVEWNNTATDYPKDKCIHQLFEEQVEHTPDAIALIFEDEQLTYRELNERANQLAHYLQFLGLRPESLVGICLERSLEMVVGLLGILKAGGAYIPLDPSYPRERLAFMLEDTDAPVLLTQQSFFDLFTETKVTVVSLDNQRDEISYQPVTNPKFETRNDVKALSPAYIIYTSGSTGIPKGVTIPHRAINRLLFHTNYIDLQSTDRIAQASNVSFDAATFEIWGALAHGATLIGIPRDATLEPQRLAAHLRQQEISVLFLTTALFNQVALAVPDAFASLRYLLFGGEAVDPKTVSIVLQQGCPTHLLHVYGPTESTTYSTWYPVRTVPEDALTVPIGGALANTRLYVLDSQLQPAPLGVAGELYIGGDGLALEYHNRPELTAERFIPNPFVSQDTSKRLYKTGDLVRWLPEGSIEFLGRIDNQVKIRGFRIELGEIEAVLSQHSDIQKTVAVVRKEGDRQQRIVAYVVPKMRRLPHNGKISNVGEESHLPDLQPASLRSYLKEKLPDYMIPAAFVLLDALPLNPNGKVDRKALPAPALSGLISSETFVPPDTPTEIALANIWSEILHLDRIGIYDNFFELGGHSLLATQVISRIEAKWEKHLSLQNIFERPTVKGLAERIDVLEMIPTLSMTADGLMPDEEEGEL